MRQVHFMCAPSIVKQFASHIVLRHKDYHKGYFADLFEGEFWLIVKAMCAAGYRVDINPGAKWTTLMARHVNHPAIKGE